ncbi:hypothetical protein C8Q78DRAFT_700971 [Trametes maxima]|nr:hypothetical protein C8Q78DRAFT_700971 [Trametes maxima]
MSSIRAAAGSIAHSVTASTPCAVDRSIDREEAGATPVPSRERRRYERYVLHTSRSEPKLDISAVNRLMTARERCVLQINAKKRRGYFGLYGCSRHRVWASLILTSEMAYWYHVAAAGRASATTSRKTTWVDVRRCAARVAYVA